MKIITVSGERSGVGKTAVAEFLLGRLKGWAALKVTTVKGGPCPKGKSCGVCKDQAAPFTIISAPRIIGQKGKDTQRMKSAGAGKVVWLKAKTSGLEEGLRQALKRFNGSEGVIVEGTSVLKYLKPDLGIFVTARGGIRLKKCS